MTWADYAANCRPSATLLCVTLRRAWSYARTRITLRFFIHRLLSPTKTSTESGFWAENPTTTDFTEPLCPFRFQSKTSPSFAGYSVRRNWSLLYENTTPSFSMFLQFTGVNNPHNAAPPYSRAMRRARRGRTSYAETGNICGRYGCRSGSVQWWSPSPSFEPSK